MRGEQRVELGKKQIERIYIFRWSCIALPYYTMYLQLSCGWEALGKRFTTCSVGYGLTMATVLVVEPTWIVVVVIVVIVATMS
jgi:hypothetical protein